jgi:hypothetical protein
MEFSLGTVVTASKEQVAADLAEEVVILNLKSGEYYGLNTVGAKIWSLVQEPTSVASVRDRLLGEFPDVDPDRCTNDMLELLGQLVEAELIDIVSE